MNRPDTCAQLDQTLLLMGLESLQIMIGDNLKKLRKERGWTQKELEDPTGIAQRNISSYEAGKLKPSGRTISRFAAAFEVNVEDLTPKSPPWPWTTPSCSPCSARSKTPRRRQGSSQMGHLVGPAPESHPGNGGQLMISLTIEIEQEDDGRWIAEVMELSGVMVYGQSPEEATRKAKSLALQVLADQIAASERDDLDSISFTAA